MKSDDVKPEASDKFQLFQVDLQGRLLDASKLSLVEQSLNNDLEDVVLVCADDEAVPAKKVVLENMSGYFEGIFRSNMVESASRRIKTQFEVKHVSKIVTFMNSGEIKLDLENIRQFFVASEYFQIDTLVEVCKQYLISNTADTVSICLDLVKAYGDLEELGEKAAGICAQFNQKYADTIIELPAGLFAAVLYRDNFKANCEDEVAEWVMKWTAHTQRSKEEIQHVLEHIRYPYLTPRACERLLENLVKDNPHPFMRLCLDRRVDELPEEQFLPRTSYADHMHLIWHESQQPLYEACDIPGQLTTFTTTCLRCGEQELLSSEVIGSYFDLTNGTADFQFVTISNSVYFVCHSRELDSLIIYKDTTENRWMKVAAVARKPSLEKFSANVRDEKIVLVLFSYYTSNRSYVEVDLETGAWMDFDYTCPRKQNPCATKISICGDNIVVLSERAVEICNRAKHECCIIRSQTPYLPSGRELYTEKFIDFVSIGSTLYVYEQADRVDKEPGLATRSHKLYKINLDTGRLEETVPVDVKALEGFSTTELNESIVSAFYNRSKVIVALQKRLTGEGLLTHYGPSSETVTRWTDLPRTVTEENKPLTRYFASSLPICFHSCQNETFLQQFCRTRKDTENAHLLERFTNYVV